MITKLSRKDPSKILVVDDRATDLKTLIAVLKKDSSDYELIGASSGEEALEKAKEYQPDLILLDLWMPDIDGFEVCRRLRGDSLLSKVPVFIITGADESEVGVDSLNAGADGVVCKPVDVEKLWAIARNITRLNRYGNIIEERNRFSQLFEHSPDGVLIVDEHGVIQLANRAFEKMLGFSTDGERSRNEGLSGESLWSFFAEEKCIWGCMACFREIDGDPSISFRQETQMLQVDGCCLFVEIHMCGCLWENSQPAIQLIVRDISDRKKAEEEILWLNDELRQRVLERTAELREANMALEKAVRSKDEFLAALSHEMRNAWMMAMGVSESLRGGTFGAMSKLQDEVLATLEGGAQQALGLLNGVCSCATPFTLGRCDGYWRECSIYELCRQSLAITQRQAHEKKIFLSLSIDHFIDQKIQADPDRLKQLLVILLNTAIHLTIPKGKVVMSVTRSTYEKFIAFTLFWETGLHDISKELGRLFQPFLQANSNFITQGEHVDLGLALVAYLTEVHEGGVIVDSKPGSSSITVKLPLQNVEETNRDAECHDEERSQKSTHRTVLLAEDNPATRASLAAWLRDQGFQVIIAANGVKAVERACLDCPELILMDIQMPLMGGMEAIQRIRSNNELDGIPIIALTTLSMPGDAELCLKLGAQAYLTKPVNFRELAATINEERRLPGYEI